VLLCLAMRGEAQSGKAEGPTYRAPGGTTLKLFLDENQRRFGGHAGEITFPPNSDSGDHKHGAIEMFIIVSASWTTWSTARAIFSSPALTGYVKPPDSVRHKTGPRRRQSGGGVGYRAKKARRSRRGESGALRT